MTMLAPFLITAIAATLQAPAPAPSLIAKAQVTAFVRIISAAEVRSGQSAAQHQRRTRIDNLGRPETLLEFE